MKKYIAIFAIIIAFIGSNSADAKTFKFPAETLTALSTEHTTISYLTLKMPEQKIVGDILLQKDAMLRIKIISVQNARRAKQNAYVDGILLAYSVPSENNKVYDVSDQRLECRIKSYSPTDFKGLAESAATTVASHAFKIPFLSQGVAVVKGVADPIDGKTRIESAGIKLYESTPLVYANKGEEINVKPGELLTVSFKIDMPEEEETLTTEDASITEQDLNSAEPDNTENGVSAQNLYVPEAQ